MTRDLIDNTHKVIYSFDKYRKGQTILFNDNQYKVIGIKSYLGALTGYYVELEQRKAV